MTQGAQSGCIFLGPGRLRTRRTCLWDRGPAGDADVLLRAGLGRENPCGRWRCEASGSSTRRLELTRTFSGTRQIPSTAPASSSCFSSFLPSRNTHLRCARIEATICFHVCPGEDGNVSIIFCVHSFSRASRTPQALSHCLLNPSDTT